MNFIKRLFNKTSPAKETPQPSAPVDFWSWFEPQREAFQQVVRSHEKVDENFLSLVMPKLREINENFACQVGMFNENTAELVVSAEGHIESFVFVEEFIASAPTIGGWIFTALSQPVHGTSLETRHHTFSTETLSFFYEEEPGYPDEIVVTIVHDGLTEENKGDIQQGVYLFLDNYLGELNSATLIDDLYIKGSSPSHPPPDPYDKTGRVPHLEAKGVCRKIQRPLV